MKNCNKPQFITFEGLEGCGKSTQSRMLFDYLKNKGIKVILTREVGGTLAAEKIRDVLVHNELLPLSELFLAMAARYEHLHKVILPALNDNTWVICDRFFDSTACYQGQYKNIGFDQIYQMHEAYMNCPDNTMQITPDLTFWIDVPINISLQRAYGRGENNKFEEKDLLFHQGVYDAYNVIHLRFFHRIMRIDAEDIDAAAVNSKVIQILQEKQLIS